MSWPRARLVQALILSGCGLVLAGCSAESPATGGGIVAESPPAADTREVYTLDRFEYSRIIMGVRARIVLYAHDEGVAISAARAAFDRMIELDGVMSDYRRDSELMRLCNRAGQGPVVVSGDLFRVLQQSVEIAEASGGAFDITVGPVVQLWRKARRSGERPEAAAIKDALQRVGWKKIKLDPEARAVELTAPGMRLDLGGVGKGFAADEALTMLRDHGVDRALVDLGGDIVAGDPPPKDPGWRVSVRSHDPEHDDLRLVITNAAVATSGDLEQFVEIDGVRYSHIINPKSGYGLTNRTAVTVTSKDGALADALASAVSVLGASAGLELLESFPSSSAAAITMMGDGRVERLQSKAFPQPARLQPDR